MLNKYIPLSLAMAICIGFPNGDLNADEIADMASAVAANGYDVPSNASLHESCDADSLCVARFLRDLVGEGAVLVPLDNVSKKTRGWHEATPSLTKSISDDGHVLELTLSRFDENEILSTLQQSQSGQHSAILIDVRHMDVGGNLDAMRRAVSLFMGKKKRAFQVRYVTGKIVDWRIPSPSQLFDNKPIKIRVGSETDAIGEVFALLLRTYANAEVIGTQTFARGYLKESIPVAHNWTLRVPTARIYLPDQSLEKGISPVSKQ